MKSQKLYRFTVISLLALSSIAVLGLFIISASNVLADGSEVGQTYPALPGAGQAGCKGADYDGTWNDTCFGYTWRKGSVNGNDNIQFGNGKDYGNGVLQGCASIGADEYYNLGMEYYNPKTYYSTPIAEAAAAASRGSHMGTFTPNQTKFGGWQGPLQDTIPGTFSESTVRQDFAIAAKLDDDGNDSTIDGKSFDESPSFCWNEAWRNCPPDDPTCGVPTTPPSNTGIYSSSIITVPGSEAGSSFNLEATANEGETKTLYFSTDKSSVNVTFTHFLHYNSNGFSLSGNDKLVTSFGDDSTSPANINTAWHAGNTISQDGHWTDQSALTSGDKQVMSQSIPLNLPTPGQTVSKCNKIDGYYRNVTMQTDKHVTSQAKPSTCTIPGVPNPIENVDENTCIYGLYGSWSAGSDEISHTDYKPEYSDNTSGFSQVCVVVYRREHPSGGATPPSGTATSNLMFAGESANITWNTSAPSDPTHYPSDGHATAYQVPSWVQLSANLGRSNAINPTTMEGGIARSYNATKAVQVPDQVGDKYCHAFDYTYTIAYGISTNGGAPSYSSYGTINYDLDTVCRTIAKKPSVAIWNSSILTNGGLLTSKADRWDAATFGNLADSSAYSRHTYGSWSEYLTVAGKGITNFSSGSSLARGSDRMALIDNSTLTIANNNGESQLGHSGIVSSTTFRTRLQTYLGANSSPLASDTITGMSNVSGTQIIRRSGDLTITGNITTNTGTYANIYEIPQVIIFVDGNVRISQNVTQIDAWIIATGEIDTCLEFVDGYTTADTINSRGNACSNQLVFNGPVIANNLKLRRSYGSDPTVNHPGTFGTSSEKYSPAEVFNLRTDVYLWAYAQAGRYDSSYTESYSRELAPRY